jgi:hypothetical protein
MSDRRGQPPAERGGDEGRWRDALEEGHFSLDVFVEVFLLQVVGGVEPLDGHHGTVVVALEHRAKGSTSDFLLREEEEGRSDLQQVIEFVVVGFGFGIEGASYLGELQVIVVDGPLLLDNTSLYRLLQQERGRKINVKMCGVGGADRPSLSFFFNFRERSKTKAMIGGGLRLTASPSLGESEDFRSGGGVLGTVLFCFYPTRKLGVLRRLN